MKKTTVFALAVLFVFGSLGLCFADPPSATFEWDPSTNRIANDDCAQSGDALTQAEIDSLEYTFSYRVKGTTTWTNVETTVPTVTLLNLNYNTTYQAAVGAHFAGKAVVCSSGLVEWTTPEAPAPGPCSIPRRVLP